MHEHCLLGSLLRGSLALGGSGGSSDNGGSLRGLALLGEDLLDDLLLLDNERTHDPLTHAGAASRSTVGTVDGSLVAGQTSELLSAQTGNL
jgi:hypothetical protein